jgi:glycerol-3-phosphate O-acyltransferase/dihydroxyacetone phosphate acyltransferase
VHTPSYLTGTLAARFLATRGEEEGQAQFKTIAGRIGIGFGTFGVAWWLIRRFVRLGKGDVDAGLSVGWNGGRNVVNMVKVFGAVLSGGEHGFVGRLKKILELLCVAYVTTWVLVTWHNWLVDGKSYTHCIECISQFSIFG